MPKLKNPRHEAFCREYLIDLNQTQAYLRVYKSTKSEKAARANSARLIVNDNVLSTNPRIDGTNAQRELREMQMTSFETFRRSRIDVSRKRQ